MRKPSLGQAKRQGGLSLIPALWEEIDRVAKLAGVPRNQVIETTLMREFLPEWEAVTRDSQVIGGEADRRTPAPVENGKGPG